MSIQEELVDIIRNGDLAARNRRSMDFRNMLISLGLSLGLFLVCVLTFSFLRRRLKSIYEPRTFIVSSNVKAPPSAKGYLGWIPATLKPSRTNILHSSGLDAYFFLRYILVVMVMLSITAIPFISVLLPLHLSGRRQGITGLDRLSTLNISDEQRARHIAHLVLCICATMGSLWLFKVELNRYFFMRAEHILSHTDIAGSASTLLIKDLRGNCQTKADICRIFAGVSTDSDGLPIIKRIWFNKDYRELQRLVIKRAKIIDKLEQLELWLVERGLRVGEDVNLQGAQNICEESSIVGNRWRAFLLPEDLAEMNGARGGLIHWLKGELNYLNSKIYRMQAQGDLFPSANSCFIQFRDKLTSFIASRSLCRQNNFSSPATVFDHVFPADIVWSNLATPSWAQKIAQIGATILQCLFIFGWAAPVAAISMMTQADMMSQCMPQIQWIIQMPRVSQIVSSVLSPLLVSGLTSQVPTIFRFLSRMKGFPTHTRVEMDVQNYLFLFMFFQLFLIVTLTTGLPSLLLKSLVNTSEGAITLANSLPKATTFFISYLLATSMITAGNTLLQSQQLCWAAWGKRRSKTPRQKLQNKCRHATLYWGSVFPLVTNIVAIAVAYALISPVIIVSALAGLSFLYVAFKYRLLYCYVPRCVADGDYYPKAIFQLFAGFYCQQISLLGSLLVSYQISLAVIAALLIIVTMACQHQLKRYFLDMSTRIPVKERCDLESQVYKPSLKLTTSVHASAASSERVFTGYSTAPPRFAPDNECITSSPASVQTLVHDNEQDQCRLGSVHVGRTSLVASSLRSLSSTTVSDINGSASSALQETWMGLFNTLNYDLGSLTMEQQSHIASKLFEHPERRMQRPCIWIPRDWKGVAQDQVLEMQSVFTDLRSSCDGAEISADGKVRVTQAPPDFDPMEYMKLK